MVFSSSDFSEHRISETFGLGALHNDTLRDINEATTHEKNDNVEHDVIDSNDILDEQQPDDRDGNAYHDRSQHHKLNHDEYHKRHYDQTTRIGHSSKRERNGFGDDDRGRRREQRHAVRRTAVVSAAGNENRRR